jgi:hypothetical protein
LHSAGEHSSEEVERHSDFSQTFSMMMKCQQAENGGRVVAGASPVSPVAPFRPWPVADDPMMPEGRALLAVSRVAPKFERAGGTNLFSAEKYVRPDPVNLAANRREIGFCHEL